MTFETALIRIRVDDKVQLEKMKDDRGISTMQDFIHYLIYIDITRSTPYDSVEMEVRRLRVELDELKKRVGDE